MKLSHFSWSQSSSELRTWLHGTEVGLSKEGADKVAAAKVLAAWEAANERTKTLRTKQAEERSAGLPAIIPGGAFIAMRRAWEEQPAANLHPGQTLKPSELPSKSFLEWRYTQVEEGEFLTESLAEVTSQQEEAQQTEDTTTADVIQQGGKAVIQMRRTRVKSQMPQTTEQLRHKYRLLAVHWGMLCARYPNKAWAAQYHPNQFRDHVDWLLGDEVAELRAVASEGRDSVKPTWLTILRYELEVRKETMRRINMCGLSLKDALWQARNSDDLRTRFLVTPLALGGRRQHEEDRPAGNRNQQPKKQSKQQSQKSQPKAAAKKRASTKTEDNRQTTKFRTAQGDSRYARTLREDKSSLHLKHNGDAICFAYQTPEGCARGPQKCNFRHICAHCFGNHSFDTCKAYQAR